MDSPIDSRLEPPSLGTVIKVLILMSVFMFSVLYISINSEKLIENIERNINLGVNQFNETKANENLDEERDFFVENCEVTGGIIRIKSSSAKEDVLLVSCELGERVRILELNYDLFSKRLTIIAK